MGWKIESNSLIMFWISGGMGLVEELGEFIIGFSYTMYNMESLRCIACS